MLEICEYNRIKKLEIWVKSHMKNQNLTRSVKQYQIFSPHRLLIQRYHSPDTADVSLTLKELLHHKVIAVLINSERFSFLVRKCFHVWELERGGN